ncbi:MULTISPECIES: RICIN domain-containing protein [Streptomyces]|uniref:Ricin B lectin domain-containing protein n=1 Tax=Streptomyces clavifer TaxID=68188 RepID=A0ABS4VIA3_9ACTN|nr:MULTISPECIES: RICIN domain-containing protein [Streptomyces]MBP2363521.1 hypothetical protein [Streptomyces clavifer]MDX2748490.1 RICIN domain-containing protein [Streptomyces sp. NRRL_B-2557]GHB28668.1 hypothetical protein GCM10010392_66010 [Streptomyces clavifer]
MSSTDTEGSASPISTIAGTGAGGFKGEGEPAVSAQLYRPYGIAVDNTGVIYFSDFSNHRVRKITTDGRISTVAGTGVAGPGGDNGLAVQAQLNGPREVAVDKAGVLYIADAENHRIRKVTADGKITTVAGTGTAGSGPDGGAATAAPLNRPFGVAVDSVGSLYVLEYNNHRVRKVTADGKISTVAGTGTAGPGGGGGPAVSATLYRPFGIAVDAADDLYIADTENHRVRKVTADGKISTVAGTGTAGAGGDGGLAASAQLNRPMGVVVDSAGTLYITDFANNRVRAVAADGKISTVAGTGTAGFGGDGGPAISAQLQQPIGIAVDCVDGILIADYANHRMRKIASAKMAGLPNSGAEVSWANVRSKLRLGVLRESLKDGATVHQSLAGPRAHQRWRLVVSGQDGGEVLYRIENLRSGKVLEVVAGGTMDGAVIAQRAYEGSEAGHQQWRLIPAGPVTDTPRVYEIANRNSGLLLSIDTNAPSVIKQYGAQRDPRDRQWQLLPV